MLHTTTDEIAGSTALALKFMWRPHVSWFRAGHFKTAVHFGTLAATIMSAALTACAPAPSAKNEFFQTTNQTGLKTDDGRAFTGAGKSSELQILKADSKLSGSNEQDRELASRILVASIDRSNKDFIRVVLSIRYIGRVFFDFSASNLQAGSDRLFNGQAGKTPSGEAAHFELSLDCDVATTAKGTLPACAIATLSLKETRGAGARAGLIVRTQDSSVIARSTKNTVTIPALKRLLDTFKTAQTRTLQTFEVAWGPSGFDLQLGDKELCPAGRLVETNELDEPLRIGCPGVTTPDVSGRMLGNTTRGEVLLEFNGTRRQFILPNEEEQVYVVVQKLKPVTAQKTTATGSVTSAQAPSRPALVPIAVPALSDDEIDTEDDGPTAVPEAPAVTTEKTGTGAVRPNPAPTQPTIKIIVPPQTGTGWLIPTNPEHPATKVWNKDRSNPIIDSAVKAWLALPRLKKFATNFLPNRDLVVGQITSQGAPAETAALTLIESTFFIEDGYPIQIGGAGEVGPWQFMLGTAKSPILSLPIVKAAVRPSKKSPGSFDPCDSRANLELSSRAAGRYMNYLIKMFPRDPKLAVLSYNWGEGNTDRAMDKLTARMTEIKNIGLNYWAVRKFNMAPIGPIQYVEKFVAAHHAFLEMEPIKADPRIAPWKAPAQCAR